MLNELFLQNYRGHAATRIPLTPLCVLVGPNGVGKSSALEALSLLGQMLDLLERAPGAQPEQVFTGGSELQWLLRRGGTEDLKVEVGGEGGEERWRLWVTASQTGNAQSTKLGWDVKYAADTGASSKLTDDAVNVRSPRSERPAGAKVLRDVVTLRLDSRRLAEPSTSEDEVPRLQEDGYGLATVLSTLKLFSTDRFHALEEAACRIVPALRAIGFKRTRLQRKESYLSPKQVIVADELLLDFVDATGLPGHAASEGTLIVIGILATLYGPVAPRLLLLEDVERALHPKAQKDLITGIRGAMEAVPDTQIIATSHSPYLVDALAPEEVVVLGRGANGQVAARRLSENPKAKLLDVLTSGELWTAEGEDWVSGV